ncbi:hypothetical protein CHS0354_002393 [Potamilus streckersoni]|uniref:Uncharacterized protein n=1 Tax=Potamilus streckersoni TaxID=2493646 RepID=A0AAE0RUA5_9BIVA|nr:hypothetical protein CHS0354_002393 [Potamilus streckersoni]
MDGKGNANSISNSKEEQVVNEPKELICPLCLKNYKTPRILPCVDTFCEECLSAYIHSTRIHNGFACPTCKASIAPPNKGESYKSWTSIFPLNAIAIPLSSADETKSEDYCDRCKAENDNSTLATSFCVVCKEHFCDGCVKSHKSFKALNNHRIIQKNDPSIKLMSSLRHVLNCAKHPEKDLDHFCRDHNCACCAICTEMLHRGCPNALKLLSYAQEKLQITSSREILSSLHEVESQLLRFIDTNEKQIHLLQEKVKDLPDEIRKMRVKINEILDVLEKRIVAQGDKIFQEESNKFQENNQRCKSLVASIQLSTLVLETASKHGTDIQNYLTQQTIAHKLDRMKEEVLNNYMKTKTVDIALKFHQIFHDLLLLNERKMLELDVKDVTKPIPSYSKTLSPRKNENNKREEKASETKLKTHVINEVEFLNTIETLYPADGVKPRYTGATFLPEGNILLVDFNNNKCCLYDSHYDFVDDFNLHKNPRHVCHLEGKKVAVTIPMSKEIEILVIDKGIRSVKTVTTRHRCFGLTTLNSERLVVSGHNRNTKRHFWAIITTGGKERHYQEIEETVSGSNISHVTVNGAKTCVYVSCAALEAVFSFTLDGQLVYRYTDKNLKHPQGLAADQYGNIYVLGYESNNLHQISPEGLCIKVFSSGIPQNPRHICFTETKQMLLITHGRFFSEHCTVFKLKHQTQ